MMVEWVQDGEDNKRVALVDKFSHLQEWLTKAMSVRQEMPWSTSEHCNLADCYFCTIILVFYSQRSLVGPPSHGSFEYWSVHRLGVGAPPQTVSAASTVTWHSEGCGTQ